MIIVAAGGRRRPLALAVALALSLVLVACSNQTAPSPSPTTTPSATPAAPTATASPSPSPSASPSPTPTPTAIPTPTATAPAADPPKCRYDDVATTFGSTDDWQRTLLDTIYRIPAKYAPTDLVSTGGAGISGGGSVRSFVIADLKAMTAAAKSAGASIRVRSAYRSYATQVTTFNYWVSQSGYTAALKVAARPGHSEHQLGTTIDFGSAAGAAPWNYADWATSKAGAWMKANAWRYGFVMSYPKGKTSSTCYSYEPWHYRYWGVAIAKFIHDSGLVPRVWLWRTSDQ
ncbi:MAG: M15 family metallopeptidase [Candidatus Limnocylindrales bacterium]